MIPPGKLKDLYNIGLKGHLSNFIINVLGKILIYDWDVQFQIILNKKWAFLREVFYQLHCSVLK